MARRQFKLTEQEDKELERAFMNTKDGATRIRYQAVRLYGQGYGVDEIRRITGCSPTSLLEWCAKYREQGVQGIVDHRGGPQRAKLTPEQVREVGEKLHEYSPYNLFGPAVSTAAGQYWTVTDLAQALEKWYGVTWKSGSSYRDLLAQCGFSYQRTEKVYKSRREREVMEFEERVEKN